MRKVIIPYAHRSDDLATIYLAIGDGKQPITAWLPAGRDTIGGKRVIWAKFDMVPRGVVTVWVRDGSGERPRTQITL
ncbi:MAG: hypothetical protein GEU78_09660 [Actinobacteria bacterium]|nr:hypothetical protein [Actinomycetota bacterium]